MTGIFGKNSNKMTELICAAPGMMYCAIILIMLIADVVFESMVEKQYVLFPLLCRSAMLICTIGWAAVQYNKQKSLKAADKSRSRLNLSFTEVMFICFFIWMMISTCINGFTKEAIFSVPYRYVGVMDLAVFILVYMNCSSHIGSARTRHMLLITYMIVADLSCLVTCFHWFVRDIPAIGGENPASCIFFHENHYAYFLTMAILISAGYSIFGRSKMMMAGLFSLILNMFVLAVNRTEGCFLAVIAAIAVMLIYMLIYRREYTRRILILMAFFASSVMLVLLISEEMRIDLYYTAKELVEIIRGEGQWYAGHGRWQLWQVTADYIVDEPLFGYGCEGIAETLYDYTEVYSPHNEVLAYAAFFGIPAAMFYLAGCISAIIGALKSCRSEDTECGKNAAFDSSCMIAAVAALSYLISSMFGVAMFYTVPYFFILIGLASSNNRQKRIDFINTAAR